MRCRSVTFAWPWDGSGGGCLSAVARKPVYPGLRWSAEWLAGSRKLTFVTLILGSALALLPKARAGCSNAARPDPWRGLWATMIPTPTNVQSPSLVLPRDAGEETGGGWNDWNYLNG